MSVGATVIFPDTKLVPRNCGVTISTRRKGGLWDFCAARSGDRKSAPSPAQPQPPPPSSFQGCSYCKKPKGNPCWGPGDWQDEAGKWTSRAASGKAREDPYPCQLRSHNTAPRARGLSSRRLRFPVLVATARDLGVGRAASAWDLSPQLSCRLLPVPSPDRPCVHGCVLLFL